jgi:CubicO group peptidase (beta-lactamase class C family)
MKVIPVLTFLLLLQPANAQYNWKELDKELQSKQKLLGNNLVCLLWKGDSLIYKKEMGGFNSKTVAPIASCSKWLTAALVMQFVDEGRLSLDDKVANYLPLFNKYSKGDITIRNCLSHMTGIADDKNFMKRILERRKFTSLEEEVNSFAGREMRADPGTDFWYGNVGLNIAGRVLEVISKKKFEVLIKEKLFTPLDMTKTSFNDSKGYPVNPSGGAQSTADDYMKFLVMLLNHGQYKGKQVLSEPSIQLMTEVQNKRSDISYAPAAAKGYTYALGSWVVEDETNITKKIDPNQPIRDYAKMPKPVATALACPGLFGTWPMIDHCRGYAYIVFVKNYLGEEKAEVHKELKMVIDKQITFICK